MVPTFNWLTPCVKKSHSQSAYTWITGGDHWSDKIRTVAHYVEKWTKLQNISRSLKILFTTSTLSYVMVSPTLHAFNNSQWWAHNVFILNFMYRIKPANDTEDDGDDDDDVRIRITTPTHPLYPTSRVTGSSHPRTHALSAADGGRHELVAPALKTAPDKSFDCSYLWSNFISWKERLFSLICFIGLFLFGVICFPTSRLTDFIASWRFEWMGEAKKNGCYRTRTRSRASKGSKAEGNENKTKNKTHKNLTAFGRIHAQVASSIVRDREKMARYYSVAGRAVTRTEKD